MRPWAATVADGVVEVHADFPRLGLRRTLADVESSRRSHVMQSVRLTVCVLVGLHQWRCCLRVSERILKRRIEEVAVVVRPGLMDKFSGVKVAVALGVGVAVAVGVAVGFAVGVGVGVGGGATAVFMSFWISAALNARL